MGYELINPCDRVSQSARAHQRALHIIQTSRGPRRAPFFDANKLQRLGLGWLLATSALASSSVALAQATSAQYVYDAVGRLIGVVDATGSAIYNYDAVGNTLSIVRTPSTVLGVVGTTPATARIGQSITIYGTNFGTTANTTVSFNGASATPSSVTPTSIAVTVPAGATSGTLSVTSHGVGPVSSPANFNISGHSTPSITSFTPLLVSPGGTITITGSGFSTNAAQDKVFVNNRTAEILGSPTPTTIKAMVPSVGAGSVSVEVINGSNIGTATASGGPLEVVPSVCGIGIGYAYVCEYPSSTTWQTFALPPTGGSSITLTLSATNPGAAVALFQGAAGQRIYYLENDGSNCCGDKLSGPDGVQITESIQGPHGGYIQAFTLPVTGTYSIIFSPPYGGMYSAPTQVYTVPADQIGVLTPGGVNAASVTLTSTTAGQGFDLSFGAAANQNYLVDSEWTSALGTLCNEPTMIVRAPDVASYQPIGGGCFGNGNAIEWASISLPSSTTEAGAYTVNFEPGVGLPSTGGSASGAATFTVFAVPPPAGGTLSVPSTGGSSSIVASTTVPGQTFLSTFSPTTSNSFTFSLLGQATLTQIDGRGPAGYQVNAVNTGNPSESIPPFPINVSSPGYAYSGPVVLPAPAAGTYDISVVPAYNNETATGSVSLTLWNVPPAATGSLSALSQSSISPVIITPGQAIAAALVNGASTARVVALQFTPTMSQAPGNQPEYNVTITPPVGSSCGTNSIYNALNLSSSLYTENVTLSCAGSYTLSVTGNTTTIGTFAITSFPVLTSLGTLTQSNALTLSTTSPAGDFDAIYVSGTSQNLSLGAATPFSAGATVTLFDSTAGTLVTSNGSGGPGTISVGFAASAGHTYSALVEPAAPVSGSVTFAISPNAPAYALDPNGSTNRYLIGEQQQPLNLHFSASASQRVSLLVEADQSLVAPGECYDVIISAPGGNTLYDSGPTCDESTFSGPVPGGMILDAGLQSLPTTGTYAVQIRSLGSSAGAANVTLYNVPPDIIGRPSIGGSDTMIRTTAPGQGAEADFAGRAKQFVGVNLRVSGKVDNDTCEDITILNPNGGILRRDLNCKDTYLSGRLQLPESGNYRVVVRPTGTGVETMKFSVD